MGRGGLGPKGRVSHQRRGDEVARSALNDLQDANPDLDAVAPERELLWLSVCCGRDGSRRPR